MSNPLVDVVEKDARALAESLKIATDAGVGPAILLPTLMAVFKEAGLFSGNLADLRLPA